jgi:signal transduction histidine kinase
MTTTGSPITGSPDSEEPATSAAAVPSSGGPKRSTAADTRARWPTPFIRSERLIAVGRVVLAAAALAAVWADPEQPVRLVPIVYGALVAYLGYAVVVLAFVVTKTAPASWLPLATHVVDIATSPVLMYLTEGPASPFYLYFLFPLLAATLRWQWAGVARTAAVSLPTFLGMAVYSGYVLRDPDFEIGRFIVRSVFLTVVAALLVGLGAHEQRLRSEMQRLAAGVRPVGFETDVLVREALDHAAAVLPARQVVVVWDDPEEPWLNVGQWNDGQVATSREPPDGWFPLVAPSLEGESFVCASGCVSTRSRAGREAEAESAGRAPVHAAFRERFAFESVLSVPLRGVQATGRLFWFDKADLAVDDLLPAEVIGRQVGAQIDQLCLAKKLRRSAAAEARVKIARDLHDGLLQSLAATGLQLETARALLEREPEQARQHLAEARRVLAAEQRDLRSLINQLHPDYGSGARPSPPLHERLSELAGRLGRQRGVAVAVAEPLARLALAPPLAHQAYLLLHEAVVNAARHSGARSIRVDAEAVGADLRLKVADDGRGFPFRGRYDGAALAASSLGPRSLRERLAGLGGRLVVESTPQGSTVEMVLPIGARTRP